MLLCHGDDSCKNGEIYDTMNFVCKRWNEGSIHGNIKDFLEETNIVDLIRWTALSMIHS